MQGEHICTTCGYIGKPKKFKRGSVIIELILWLFLVIPGFVYSLWRLSGKYMGCPKCKDKLMIPTDTPNGKKLVAKQRGSK